MVEPHLLFLSFFLFFFPSCELVGMACNTFIDIVRNTLIGICHRLQHIIFLAPSAQKIEEIVVRS